MQNIPDEKQPIIRQTTSIVDGQVFVTSEKVQEDINGNEFIVLRTTQPYQGSIEDYKAELEAAKTQEIERHDAVITDVDAKLSDVDSIIKPKGK